MRTLLLSTAIGATLLMGQIAGAVTGHFEGFEDAGFTPGGNNWNNYNGGQIERVTSGTNGITSSSGGAHAIITNLSEASNPVLGGTTLGAQSPFTRFGGYSSTFGDGFVASLDIYLDPASLTDGDGFDYSVAVNNQSGNHLRDFIFHVGVDGGDLLVNGSNNTDYSVNAFKLNNENGGNNYTVTSAGWYTFEHVFRNDGGILAVDLNLYDSSSNLLWTATRSNAADDIATVVGGNRYGFFTVNNIDGLAIDNTSLEALVVGGAPVPEPATAAMGVMGLVGLALAGRRRRA